MTSSRQLTRLPRFSAANRYGALDAGLRAAAALVADWIVKRRTRGHLARLDDHALKDIGLTRDEARREAYKPFWL